MCISILLLSIGCREKPAQQQGEKLSYTHPIPFSPSNYVCQRASGTITIDGKDNEASWKNAKWSSEFVDIEGTLKPLPKHKTQFKMLWDSSYLYFYAKMDEPHIWATLKNRDDIIYFDDDFEIFIDPDGDSHNYYELEWNAYNTLWDLILLRPYRVDDAHKVLFNWNVDNMKTATHVEGTLNDASDVDSYWSIEIAIGWSVLKEFATPQELPKDGDQWRINFSRVDWTMENDGKDYKKAFNPDGSKIPENNWVWSPTGRVNMHMPEMWGFVQFSQSKTGGAEVAFTPNPEEKVKWGLWNLYWQQIEYFKINNSYADTTDPFTLPQVDNCTFAPKIYTTPNYFEISSPSCSGNAHWVIQKDGKIYLKK